MYTVHVLTQAFHQERYHKKVLVLLLFPPTQAGGFPVINITINVNVLPHLQTRPTVNDNLQGLI